MARKGLFEYAALFHPKQTHDSSGNDTTPPDEIIIPITSTLAKDDREVQIMAARALPDKFLDKLEDVEIVVRPL